ncbi:GDSL-type esterase/lipase family protein [Actinoplanes sp. NBC_00393]|uniref:SGNH/GDSL hydrolase family protein n=1 Tax=Actinoplanes sp. NBC_00393 TaxID=2975953 RepID=UPI002E21C615
MKRLAALTATTALVAAGIVAHPSTAVLASGQAVAPDTRVLARVHTAGRVEDRGAGVRYTWPGVYFEGRFRGSSVGIVLDDAVNDYAIQIDDQAPVNLVTPGRTTHWVRGLDPGAHRVRIAKRTESPWSAGQFGGFVVGAGGAVLSRPVPRSRQIEFIGDSWTAGYGNMSASRDCSTTGGVDRNSNADQSFGALTARALGADYQLNAWSGRGMVRNYNGGDPGTDYRTYYDRTLQAADPAVWRPGSWKPQVVVIGLGINDFSTALNPGEQWADEAALAAAYRTAYQGFLDKLRQRYGARVQLVLTYPDMWNTTAFASSVEQIVAERNAAGDNRVRALHYETDALGLDSLGCDWHPSARDHQLLAGVLTSFLRALPVRW